MIKHPSPNVQNTTTNLSNSQGELNPHETYFHTKKIAILLEKTNNSKIIAFPSTPSKSGKIEWYKIGGNSAFFYKYFVAPRLGKKSPTIHHDTDLNHRFKRGVVFVHWKKSLINNLTSLGYKYKEDYGILIFDLGHTFSAEEIKKLHQKASTDRQNANQLFRPTNNNPRLYVTILELTRTIPIKAKKLKDGFRDDYAPELNRAVIQLNKTYFRYANGRIPESQAKLEFFSAIDDLTAILSILSENDCLDLTSQIRIGRLIADFKTNLEKISS